MIPLNALDGELSDNRAGITRWQVRRAAWLVYRILDFKGRLHTYVFVLSIPTCELNRQFCSQELHPDTTRTGILLCSHDPRTFDTNNLLGIWLRESTRRMFNIGRVPKPYCDELSSPPPHSPPALKLLLMIHNWCYTVDVYHPPNSSSSMPLLLKPHEIESRIKAIVLDVEQRLCKGETAFPIGVLSADDRDRWAKARRF